MDSSSGFSKVCVCQITSKISTKCNKELHSGSLVLSKLHHWLGSKPLWASSPSHSISKNSMVIIISTMLLSHATMLLIHSWTLNMQKMPPLTNLHFQTSLINKKRNSKVLFLISIIVYLKSMILLFPFILFSHLV